MAHPFFLTPTSKQILYYYNNSNNEPVGPLTIDKLREMFQNKQLGPHVWVIEKGGNDWKRLADLLADNPVRMVKKASLPQKSSSSTSSANVPLPPFAAKASMSHVKVEPAKPKIEPKPEPKFESKFEPRTEIKAEPVVEHKQEPLYVSRTTLAQASADIVETVQAPMPVQIMAVLSFISGFANIFAGLTWMAMGIFFLKGDVLVPMIPSAYGLVVGIYNIIFASKLLSAQFFSRAMARYLALLDIASFPLLNPVSCLSGFINFGIGLLSPGARAYFSNTSKS